MSEGNGLTYSVCTVSLSQRFARADWKNEYWAITSLHLWALRSIIIIERGKVPRGREETGRVERGREERGSEEKKSVERGREERRRVERRRDERGREKKGREV